MFNSFIDAVQDGKKKVVTTTVKDEKISTELVKLIDAQTMFYKGWVDTTLTLAQTLVATAPKFPFAQGAK